MLIDLSYLQKEVVEKEKEQNDKFQLDYKQFSDNLCNEIGAERFRTYIYDVMLDSNEGFLKSLGYQDRFEIRSGKLIQSDSRNKNGNREGYRQKQVDILLAIDMIKLALKGKIQHIILITGDSDFVPAVQFVKEEGILVHLWHAENCSSELSQTCDTSKRIPSNFLAKYEGKEPRI